jgi:hypothetical protein
VGFWQHNDDASSGTFFAHAVLAVQAGYVSVSLLAKGNLKGTQLEIPLREFRACAMRNIKILRGRVAQTYV